MPAPAGRHTLSRFFAESRDIVRRYSPATALSSRRVRAFKTFPRSSPSRSRARVSVCAVARVLQISARETQVYQDNVRGPATGPPGCFVTDKVRRVSYRSTPTFIFYCRILEFFRRSPNERDSFRGN